MAISAGASNMRDRSLVQELIYEQGMKMYFSKMGQISMLEEGKQTIILRKKDLKKKSGEYVRVPFSPMLTDAPIIGDREAEGNEEEMDLYTQDVYIDQVRKPVRLKGDMDEKKVAYNMRMQAKHSISTYLSRFTEKDLFYKASGILTATDEIRFANTPTAPSSYRNLFGGDATEVADIDSADKMSLDLISRCKVKATTEVAGVPVMPELDLPNNVKYVMFCHPYQIYDLKRDPEWNANQREAAVRGIDNPLFKGSPGMHDGVLIVEHPFVQTFSTWGGGGVTTGARALFMGANAILLAEGRDPKWVEKSLDYDNKWSICSGLIYGLQKTKFNSIDYSIISADTYIADPNA
jgi:N4-gp56 family major capsid protein